MTSANQPARMGAASEVSHVGIERLGAGDRQDHRAQHEEAAHAVRGEVAGGMLRPQRRQHRGVVGDLDRRRARRSPRTRPP